MFSILSRYAGLAFGEHITPDGRTIVYVRRRFVPAAERFQPLLELVVTEGERLDTITAQRLGDPEQFWRVCDANGVIEPAELEVTGRRVRITLPEGIPGPRRA